MTARDIAERYLAHIDIHDRVEILANFLVAEHIEEVLLREIDECGMRDDFEEFVADNFEQPPTPFERAPWSKDGF